MSNVTAGHSPSPGNKALWDFQRVGRAGGRFKHPKRIRLWLYYHGCPWKPYKNTTKLNTRQKPQKDIIRDTLTNISFESEKTPGRTSAPFGPPKRTSWVAPWRGPAATLLIVWDLLEDFGEEILGLLSRWG